MTNAAEEHGNVTLQCEEVWGGNRRVDRHVRLPGLDAHVVSQPYDGANSGGDVHYVSACSGRKLVRILVADVSGHGTQAADTAQTLRTLMSRLINDRDQVRLMRELSDSFGQATAAADTASETAMFRFATAVVLTYDVWTRQLLICNAGHPPPLWYQASLSQWTTLESVDEPQSDNLPMGIVNGSAYEQFEVALDVGDVVLCYTDPMIESLSPSGEILGVDGLLEFVRRVVAKDPGRIVAYLLDHFVHRGSPAPVSDDLTCLSVRVTDDSAAE